MPLKLAEASLAEDDTRQVIIDALLRRYNNTFCCLSTDVYLDIAVRVGLGDDLRQPRQIFIWVSDPCLLYL